MGGTRSESKRPTDIDVHISLHCVALFISPRGRLAHSLAPDTGGIPRTAHAGYDGRLGVGAIFDGAAHFTTTRGSGFQSAQLWFAPQRVRCDYGLAGSLEERVEPSQWALIFVHIDDEWICPPVVVARRQGWRWSALSSEWEPAERSTPIRS